MSAPEKCPHCGAEPIAPFSSVFKCESHPITPEEGETPMFIRGRECYKRELAALRARVEALEGALRLIENAHGLNSVKILARETLSPTPPN